MRAFFADAAGTAAKFLAREDGPRIGALAFNGWDTHIDEGADSGRLATLLGALDGALAAVEKSMGEAWRETVVTVVTEFGRTARINGTNGTDHGTGTIAILAGGALKGGRVIADWPGLKNASLYEGRDLAATTDLRAVLKGLLRDHLRVTDQALATAVFPGSADVKAMAGLVGVAFSAGWGRDNVAGDERRTRWRISRNCRCCCRPNWFVQIARGLDLAIKRVLLVAR